MNAHRCRIDYVFDQPFYPGHPGYVTVCDECGAFGPVHDDPRDAQAIANRHETIGGFERP